MSQQPQTLVVCKLGDNGQKLHSELSRLSLNCVWHPLQKITFNHQAIVEKQPCISAYDGLIITSKYAVKAAAQWLQDNIQSNQLVYAIGPATLEALKKLNIDAICLKDANSEALVSLLANNNQLTQNWLLCKGDGGRELLETDIRKAGGQIDVWPVYQRVDDPEHQHQVTQTLINSDSALIVCTNGESLAILKHIIQRLDFSAIQVIVPSERLVALAKSLGFETVWNSGGPMNHSIIQCIKQVLNLTT
jgi:uroporphyrinogen-III synthase